MKQAWDKNVFENGQCKPLGTADSAPSFERLQSTGPGEKFDEKALPVAGGLSGAGGNLPLTPAGLRLARLQAQLTLQRLRLAHGGHAAVAVLDRVLLDAAAMAQPPSDRLGGSGAPRAPGAAFPPAPVTFPPPGTPAGGAFPGNLAGIGTNRYGGGNASRIANPPGDRDRFGTGGTDGGTPAGEGGRYGGPEIDGRTRFYSSDSQIRDSERWIDPNGYTHRLPPTPVPTSGLSAWAPSTPGFVGPLAEPYDPEEPTADRQGIVRWPQKGEEGATLQAHQLDDYRGVTPSRLPHRCSICEKKVYNPKDWDRHVKGKSHAQNRSLYTDGPALGALRFPVVSGGCRGPAPNDDAAAAAAAGRDVSTGGSSFLQAAPMTSFPLSGAGFALHGPGTKFVVRNQCPGRVVHICNLPEGSCTENDVINLGLPFGQVTNYILMRSTHQAFLEMAYVEAAQAMVQYYQLRPATVDEQKLLIRMSKRYKELQLKKPGKDVESIIQDINFRREREEPHVSERYPPDRARSRSPVVRSVTPPSHSPGFTSCSSAHSPRRGSRDREERRNGEGQRGRERRFSSRRPADEFYEKEPAPRRRTNEAGFERRDGSGDRRRSRRSESELPEHGRRGRTSRTHEREDRAANRHRESTEHRGKERSSSPRAGKPTETSEGQRDRESEADGCGSGEDAEGDRWYPKSMEELVTVDEVGEEDDSVVEPDLPELREEERPEEDGKEERDDAKKEERDDAKKEERDDAKKEERDDAKKEERDDAKKEEPVPAEEATSDAATSDAATSDAATGETLSRTEASPARVSLLTDGELKRAPAEPAESPTRVSGAVETRATATHVGPDSVGATRTGSERARTGEVDKTEMRDVEEHPRKEPGRQTLPPEGSPPRRIGVEAPSPSREQERTVGEHGIPLGVEFIVPSAGFYCKLCGLFYASEETAKTAHCRSAVHYRNLQKYLSRLAEESPLLFRSDAE